MSLKDFEIGKQLGKGAFGTVCIVKRKEDGQTYAMKRVKIAQMESKERDNALNEIRLLASLRHPNIIDYHEAFFDEQTQTLNIVMEYADDGDIERKIQENKTRRLHFQESTIWIWLIQILLGLKYLHDNKIMHRDLKCANLFLTKKGVLKLGDLNVSKLARMGMAATQTGTPYYASPEVWLDKPYNYKSDIWSVGCIIYEACASVPPFRGTSMKGLFANVKKGYYPDIPSMYSKDLSKVISMMLIVDPNKRVSTDALLNCDIIQKKMQVYKTQMNAEIIEGGNHLNDHADLIKTIKMPRVLKEINKQLPKKRYQKKKMESEMIENDEYETQKANFFKQFAEEAKINNNRPVTSDNQQKPLNNYNRDYKVVPEKPLQQPIIPNKYNYLNKYDNNMARIPDYKNQNDEKDKKKPEIERKNNQSENEGKNNKHEEKDMDEERKKIHEQYLKNMQNAQLLMNNKKENKSPIDINKINEDYHNYNQRNKKISNDPYQNYEGINKHKDLNQNYNKNNINQNDPYQNYKKDIKKPNVPYQIYKPNTPNLPNQNYKPSDPYQKNNPNANLNKLNEPYKNYNPSINKPSPLNRDYNSNNNNNYNKISSNNNDKYNINKQEKIGNYNKDQRPIQQNNNDKQARYRNLFSNEDTVLKPPKGNKNELGFMHHHYNPPPLGNNHRPITAKNPASNILDKKIYPSPYHYEPNQVKNLPYQYPSQNQNPYIRPAGKPSIPSSGAAQYYNKGFKRNPPKKVVYEEIDYKNYIQRKANNQQGNGNRLNVENRNNLYQAMGIRQVDKYNYVGPKIVNHRK